MGIKGQDEQPTQSIPTTSSSTASANESTLQTIGDPGAPIEDELGSDAEAYAALKARRAERRKKKLIRRGIAAGVVAVVVIVAALVISSLSQEPETVVEPVTDYVLRGTFSTEVNGKGTLQPLSATTVSPTVDGTVSEVRVASGQAVNAGDVLMVLKNDELDQAVTDAQRTLSDAQADLAAAQQALKTAQAGTTTYDDEGNAIWEAGDTASAQEQVNTAQRSVETAQATLTTAQAKANERTITAPAAGSVIDLNVQVGSVISGGCVTTDSGSKSPMQIADLSQMRVTVQVGEEEIMSVAAGQNVDVTFPAISDLTSSGTVETIATVASSDVSSYDGSSSVVFDVSILIPQPDSRLKPGMTAKANIITQQIDDVIMVPTAALVTDDGSSYYVRRETNSETHEYEEVAVEVIAKNDNYAVVGRPADDDTVSGDVNDPGAATGSSEEGTTGGATSNASLPVSPLSEGDTLITMLGSDDSSYVDGTDGVTHEDGTADGETVVE